MLIDDMPLRAGAGKDQLLVCLVNAMSKRGKIGSEKTVVMFGKALDFYIERYLRDREKLVK